MEEFWLLPTVALISCLTVLYFAWYFFIKKGRDNEQKQSKPSTEQGKER